MSNLSPPPLEGPLVDGRSKLSGSFSFWPTWMRLASLMLLALASLSTVVLYCLASADRVSPRRTVWTDTGDSGSE
ncbi:hypothetical protein ACN28E_53495 [Archangium lansingense]|uniref:hypothetical protein n=1 Tax=Archangium lansingense TaxID=2995310 RepID=UPI003B79C28E